MSNVKVIGVAAVQKELSKLAAKYPEETLAALREEGLAIESASVALVPVDTGRLRSSHYVEGDMKSSGPEVAVGYSTEYALAVHERMDVRHTVGQAKYLEQPFKAALRGYAARVAERVKRLTERGGSGPDGRE